MVRSNVESGDGFSDILVETGNQMVGIVIEVKYADDGNLEEACKEALAQIDRMGYELKLLEDDMQRIIRYGITCYKKKCKVMVMADRII